MSRLMDAEKLIQNVNDEIKSAYSAYNDGWNTCNSFWVNLIKLQSIAFDKDKVIEQLEELEKEHPYGVVGQPDAYSPYNEGWCDCLDRVIGIVKKGGK